MTFIVTNRIQSFHWEIDFEPVRQFLVETYQLTNSLQNWIPSRFDNIQYGPCGGES